MIGVSPRVVGFVLSVLLPICGLLSAQAQDNPFGAQVRPTDPLSPDEERAQLQVPEGFTVNLFAAEPDIQKPLNMAFDADGRLWVACTIEYPYAADEGKGRDSIRVLEDTDNDGRADKVTVFADNLNIPIGLYPYKDGVIAFSIPNIWFLRDTDGDGKADKREKLYGPFDFRRDTHGLNNAFRRGYDGWIYACHGHANRSTVAGADGHEITMDHGNTYRFRPDGSRIEYFGHGQVNPFGMTIDEYGDIFTSDCHSMPVSLLMRDGYHPGFGRPHDGLKFVPAVMKHKHGSTAIDAVCQYQGTGFPDEYHNDLFVGNVMTSRVHRDKIVRTGSSIRVEEKDDFIVSKDPWFRPVDIQYGPDDALYVADFYNRIIGHYEVPLDHPGRDRDSGRIWRITANRSGRAGGPGRAGGSGTEVSRLASASTDELMAALQHPDKPVRQHALDQLTDRIGDAAIPALNAAVPNADERSGPELLWALSRLNALSGEQLLAAVESPYRRVRIHAMRIASETARDAAISSAIMRGLQDDDPQVRRAAADAASRHPVPKVARQIIEALGNIDAGDVHLRHGLRIALRNQLRSSEVAQSLIHSGLSSVTGKRIADVLPGLSGATVTPLCLALINAKAVNAEAGRTALRQAAREATGDQLGSLVETTIALSDEAHDLDQSIALRSSLTDGFRRSGSSVPTPFLDWEYRLSQQILAETDLNAVPWGLYALETDPPEKWVLDRRIIEPGMTGREAVIRSQPGTSDRTGVVRSATFAMPQTLTMRLCGSRGIAKDSTDKGSRVVLRAADTGRILAETSSLGIDTGQPVEWRLPLVTGNSVYLEVIDGVNKGAYTWVGVGRIAPDVVSTAVFDGGTQSERLSAAINILSKERARTNAVRSENLGVLMQILRARHLEGATRAAAAEFLLTQSDRRTLAPLAALLRFVTLPRPCEDVIVGVSAGRSTDNDATIAKRVFETLDANLRNRLANGLAARSASALLLLNLMDQGVPSPELLRDERFRQQLVAHGSEHQQLAERLVSELPPPAQVSPVVTKSILELVKNGSTDVAAGQAVFEKHCKVCHKRAGQGGEAGPQLDGLASRGPARSLEDILLPNTNVDIAFRTSVIILTGGRAITGIVRDIGNGELLILDAEGKGQSIRVEDIDERRDMRLSLMPSNLGGTLKSQELADLLSWLMTEPVSIP